MKDLLSNIIKREDLNLRYEYKMVASNLEVMEVVSLIKRHPAMFFEPYSERCVNNIYFDTPGFTFYRNHISGAANRSKLRIRWYGHPEVKIEYPVLERKLKFGQVGGKISESLPAMNLLRNDCWPLPDSATNTIKLENHRLTYQLRSTNPVVALRYQRYYFVSADGKFRITVDYKFESISLHADGAPNRKCEIAPPIIIELKYLPEDMDFADAITNKLPFRVTRFSKYIYSINNLFF